MENEREGERDGSTLWAVLTLHVYYMRHAFEGLESSQKFVSYGALGRKWRQLLFGKRWFHLSPNPLPL